MKLQIGVDNQSGLAHSAVVTAANVHDRHSLPDLHLLSIGSSVEKVEAGNQLVGSAGKSMDEIVGATEEQRQCIEQIEQAVAQMDGMTQKNAALVEQAADAAAAMKDQSHSLVQAMASFRLP